MPETDYNPTSAKDIPGYEELTRRVVDGGARAKAARELMQYARTVADKLRYLDHPFMGNEIERLATRLEAAMEGNQDAE